MPELKIINLCAGVDNKVILRGINLEIGNGKTILLMGPNGSGKSTLAQVLIGNPKYKILSGKILFNNIDITDLPLEKRVKMGISASFQIPPKLRGIKLRELAMAILRKRGEKNPDEKIRRLVKEMKLEGFLDREINVGFSGGEMKRTELFLILLQNPTFVILDEIDSGVDVESVGILGKVIRNELQRNGRSLIIISHTGIIAKHVRIDIAYIMLNGKITCYGPPTIVLNHVLEHGFARCKKCEGICYVD
ncbi:MAG: ABC transporter ATP-binding protein [Candidatus Njordarchaeales archaeon]